MLLPKRVKYRKQHRGRMKGKAMRGNEVSYGQFGLQALEPSWVKSNQIEAARIAINRYLRRGGTVWIKIFPDKSVTARPAETRMGSGKGSPEYWVAVVRPGRVMFEIAGVSEEVAREAMRLAAHKLPMKCRFIKGDIKFSKAELAKFAEVQSDVVESLEEVDAAIAEQVEAEQAEAEQAAKEKEAEDENK